MKGTANSEKNGKRSVQFGKDLSRGVRFVVQLSIWEEY